MMTLSKKIPLLFLILIGLLGSNSLLAQRETGPKSRWSLGTSIGIPLFADCGSDCGEERSVHSAHSKNVFLHFRLLRWLGISGSLDHYRLQNYSSGNIWNEELNLTPQAQLDIRSNMFVASIGPQLLFRLGQGDLGLELLYGTGFNTMRLNALAIDGRSYDIKYQSISASSETIKLSYTYWPKPNFGLNFSVASTSIYHRGSFDQIEAKIPLEINYPDTPAEVLEQLAPTTTGSTFVLLSLGFTYRFK